MGQFLLIDGNAFDVQAQGARGGPRAGSPSIIYPTFNQTLRIIGVPFKREWSFLTAPLDRTAFQSLMALQRAFRAITGEAVDNVSVTAYVEVTEWPYVEDVEQINIGFQRICSLMIKEK